MVVPVRGLALVSGSGGTGRTTVALNLAGKLAACGQKILLADLCFGWGGLNNFASRLSTFEELIDSDGVADKIVSPTDHGFDLLTCVPPEFVDFENDDFKKLAWVLSRISSTYDLVIYDAPSGGHPLSLLAAGMSDRVFLFARPDANSFGSAYCLLKSLNLEGINSRVRLICNFTESEAHAASLKTRFDLTTDRFLGLKIASGGHILRQNELYDGDFQLSGISRISQTLIDNLDLTGIVTFQDETSDNSDLNNFPDRIFLRR
jgi:flagellar biosynthesis protein FlhG